MSKNGREISRLEITTAITVIEKVSKTFELKNISITSVSMLYKFIAYHYLDKSQYVEAVKYLMWLTKSGDAESVFVLSQLDVIMTICSLMTSKETKKLHNDYIFARNNVTPSLDSYFDIPNECLEYIDFNDGDVDDVIGMINEKIMPSNDKLDKHTKVINLEWMH